MKEFCKWLGVNEKIAKLVILIFIIMIFLVATNAMLESIGVPHYQITVDNVMKVNYNMIADGFASFVVAVLGFYAIVLLVFKLDKLKLISKWLPVYLIVNYVLYSIGNGAILDIFIIIYLCFLGYACSNKNIKYIFYIIYSLVFNALVQYIWFSFKVKQLDFSSLAYATKFFLGIDYFIIMLIIIFIKNYIERKRGDVNE